MLENFTAEQLLYEWGESGAIEMFAAKVVDDFLIAGSQRDVENFVAALNKNFELGRVNVTSKLQFLSCLLTITSVSISVSMSDYETRTKTIQLSVHSSNAIKATDDSEVRWLSSLTGTLLYYGQVVLPQSCMIASKIQQRLGRLSIGDLTDANAMIKELSGLDPTIMYWAPKRIVNVTIVTLSDASHNRRNETYGKTDLFSGLKIESDEEAVFHPILWSSHKQRKVCYSSFGAKILAAGYADDCGYHLKNPLPRGE